MSYKVLQCEVFREIKFDSIKECCDFLSNIKGDFAIEDLVDHCDGVYLRIHTPTCGHPLFPEYAQDSVFLHMKQKYLCWKSYREDEFLHCLDCACFDSCLMRDRSDEDPYVEFCALFKLKQEVPGDE